MRLYEVFRSICGIWYEYVEINQRYNRHSVDFTAIYPYVVSAWKNATILEWRYRNRIRLW